MTTWRTPPGPFGLIRPLRPGDELIPGYRVERASYWYGQISYEVGDVTVLVQRRAEGARYQATTPLHGLNVRTSSPAAGAIASALAKLLAKNESEHMLGISDAGCTSRAPQLFLVPGHLGNLRDLTLRALDVLQGAGLVLVEDGHADDVTAELTQYGIHLKEIGVIGPESAQSVRACLDRGLDVAIFGACEGVPTFADPGKELVAEFDAETRTVGGASVMGMVLMRAPISLDRFQFLGTVYDQAKAVRAARRWCRSSVPGILFSSGAALPAVCDALEATLQPPQTLHLLVELTKAGERVLQGTPASVRTLGIAPSDAVVVMIEQPPLHSRLSRLASRAWAAIRFRTRHPRQL